MVFEPSGLKQHYATIHHSATRYIYTLCVYVYIYTTKTLLHRALSRLPASRPVVGVKRCRRAVEIPSKGRGSRRGLGSRVFCFRFGSKRALPHYINMWSILTLALLGSIRHQTLCRSRIYIWSAFHDSEMP